MSSRSTSAPESAPSRSRPSPAGPNTSKSACRTASSEWFASVRSRVSTSSRKSSMNCAPSLRWSPTSGSETPNTSPLSACCSTCSIRSSPSRREPRSSGMPMSAMHWARSGAEANTTASFPGTRAGGIDQHADQVPEVGDLDPQGIERVVLRGTEHRQVDQDRALEVDIHQAGRQLAQPIAVIRRVRLEVDRECGQIRRSRIPVPVERGGARLGGVADEDSDRADGGLEADVRPANSGVENEAGRVVEERDGIDAVGQIQAEVEIELRVGLDLHHRFAADVDQVGDAGQRRGSIGARQAHQLGQVEVHLAWAAVVGVLELQLDLQRRAVGNRPVERQLDLGIVEVGRAGRIGEPDRVFEQLFDRLQRLGRIALELLDPLGELVGRLQQIAHAQVEQRQLLVRGTRNPRGWRDSSLRPAPHRARPRS